MDIFVKRFPLLAEKISNNLDNQSLVKFKKVNRENVEFMIQNRFYWIRILKNYNAYFETSKESWKKSISKTPTEFIRHLAMAALHFFNTASKDIEGFIEFNFHPLIGFFYQQLTPLHIAAYDGGINFFYEVKKKTLDPNQCLKQSRIAPIHLAAYRGHIALCRQLLEDWNENKIPCAVLHYAAVAGHLEVYMLFHDIIEVKNPLLTRQERVFTDYIGITPLHLAAKKGHSEICKFIIERVEDKNPADIVGDTPLHFAAASGHLGLCKFILKNINSLDEKNPRGRKGLTPLHLAAENGYLDICKLMFEYVDKKNPACDRGDTPLHLATINGRLNVCKLIMMKTNFNNPKNHFGNTPLHYAAIQGQFDLCKFIMENIGDKNPSGRQGDTPLHEATIVGHLNICKLIMAHIDDIHPKNSKGKTPMDIAKEINHIHILQLFRLRDATDNLRNNQFPEGVPGSLHPNFRIRLAAIYKQN